MTQTLNRTVHQLYAEHHIDRELCERRFFYFVQEFWDTIIQEPPVYNWHIEYLADQLQEVVERLVYIPEIKDRQGKIIQKEKPRLKKEQDIIINIPPGTTKSTLVSVMLPVWCWVKDPSMRVLTSSYSSGLSKDLSMKSRDIITSDKFRLLFPDIAIKRDQDAKDHYKNTKNGERLATSTGGTITGFHGHLIIVDDPINPKEALSEADRLTANNHMDQTLVARKVDKAVTVTILVMQRLHAQDPTGHALANDPTGYKHICLPGELSDHVKPEELKANYVDGLLDPIRLSRESLDEMRTRMGAYGYAGQVSQLPAPPGGGIWKSSYLKAIDDTVLDDLLAKGKITQMGTDWDLAYTKKEKNSASAFCRAGKYGNKMVIDHIDWKWLEFPELVNWMKATGGPWYIEAKASGKSAKQTLTNQGLPAVEVQVKGGEDKEARARMATPYAEAGLVLVRRSILDAMLNDARQGLLLFPNTGTDLADAVSQAIMRLLGGASFFVV